MKKKKLSIFWSIALLQLPFIIIAELIVMIFAGAVIYNATYVHCFNDIRMDTSVAENIVTKYNFDNAADAEACSKELNTLCERIDSPYIYVIEIDEKAKTEKYLAIGFGKNANEEAKEERYAGYVVKGKLKKEIVNALHGVATDDIDESLRHTNNEFGNTLIYYQKLSNDKTNTRLVGVEQSISEIMEQLYFFMGMAFVMSFLLTLIFVLSFAFVVNKRVSKPARTISERMSHFVSERGDGNDKLEFEGSLEFSQMASAYNSMTEEINKYIDDIGVLNREKHIQEAELNIASNIQLGLMAPRRFSNRFANIRAYILPAREVGGDMYDYQMLKNGEIRFAVADVSGKGVSAALFMARALTLLHMFGEMGFTPSESAKMFNNKLAEYNPNKLFITAFLGRYNHKTKKLTYVNAGHNPPYVISDKLKILDGAHGMAAGIFPDVTYEETEITLNSGDALFVYTDGVNEAQNKDGELFTTERLEHILAEHINSDKEDVIDDVLKEIREFAAGAVQSDDITMLELIADAPYCDTLKLKSDVQQLTVINDAIDAIPDLPIEINLDLKLMAEEIFVNICKYSYTDVNGDIEVKIIASDKVDLIFKDSGVQYDPTKEVLVLDDYDHHSTVGGLGKFITFNTADDYNYKYENGKNILKLTKNIPQG